MESDKVSMKDIWDHFYSDYWRKNRDLGDYACSWSKYIEDLDIGIKICDATMNWHTYKIVDERKWMLARIKYGI